jgi:hypothetical protein
MGAFYRSRHELIFAFKNGAAPHINSFELGQHGRYRTNVWEYRGVNTLKTGRLDELALHPTVKPVAMIADAIKDVSRRNGKRSSANAPRPLATPPRCRGSRQHFLRRHRNFARPSRSRR